MKTKLLISSLIAILFIGIIGCSLNFCHASWAITNPSAVKPTTTNIDSDVSDMAGNLLGVLQVLGAVVSVMALMILGIRYMTGSAQEKADYKKSMIPYIIGAVIIFSGTVFPKMIYDVVSKIQ